MEAAADDRVREAAWELVREAFRLVRAGSSCRCREAADERRREACRQAVVAASTEASSHRSVEEA
jgi:hypothetical protein